MKKILSILCVLALLMTTAAIAFAEEDPAEGTPDTTVVATADEGSDDAEDVSTIGVEEVAVNVEKTVNGIVSGLKYLLNKVEAPTVEDGVEVILEKIAADTGVKVDVSQVKALLKLQGIDISTLKYIPAEDMASVTQAIFDAIEVQYGKDTVDTVYAILKNSNIVNLFAQLYVKTAPTTVIVPTTKETTEPDTEPTPDPEPTPDDTEIVPNTGEASIIASVAVLALATAAAVVCTKKAKKDEE